MQKILLKVKISEKMAYIIEEKDKFRLNIFKKGFKTFLLNKIFINFKETIISNQILLELDFFEILYKEIAIMILKNDRDYILIFKVDNKFLLIRRINKLLFIDKGKAKGFNKIILYNDYLKYVFDLKLKNEKKIYENESRLRYYYIYNVKAKTKLNDIKRNNKVSGFEYEGIYLVWKIY